MGRVLNLAQRWLAPGLLQAAVFHFPIASVRRLSYLSKFSFTSQKKEEKEEEKPLQGGFPSH